MKLQHNLRTYDIDYKQPNGKWVTYLFEVQSYVGGAWDITSMKICKEHPYAGGQGVSADATIEEEVDFEALPNIVEAQFFDQLFKR